MLSLDQIDKIKDLNNSGFSKVEIANTLGISLGSAYKHANTNNPEIGMSTNFLISVI